MQICDTYGVKVIVPNLWRTGIDFVYDFSAKGHHDWVLVEGQGMPSRMLWNDAKQEGMESWTD